MPARRKHVLKAHNPRIPPRQHAAWLKRGFAASASHFEPPYRCFAQCGVGRQVRGRACVQFNSAAIAACATAQRSRLARNSANISHALATSPSSVGVEYRHAAFCDEPAREMRRKSRVHPAGRDESDCSAVCIDDWRARHAGIGLPLKARINGNSERN